MKRGLTYEACVPIIRKAMIAFSRGETRQLLRSLIPLANGHIFGVMPGALGETAPFGAKLISVYPENFAARPPVASGRGRAVRSGRRRARLHRACGRDHRHPHRRGQRRRDRCARAARRMPPRDPGLWRACRKPMRAPWPNSVRSTSISVWGRAPGRLQQVLLVHGGRTRHPV